MELTGNKGEWSEIYTLFKLLGDGRVYAGDAQMNKQKLYYPILNIIREESKRYEYRPNQEKNVVIIDEDGKEYAQISIDRFVKESKSLLKDIINGKGSSFSIPNTEKFMKTIGCSKVKADSLDKSDIHIVIHDLRTNMTPTLGFSIKSQLGSASTLLNASVSTNFLYKIEGVSITDEDIESINSINDHFPRLKAIFDKGCVLKYSNIENATFKNNLLFMDSRMPEFVALCLIEHNISFSSSKIKDVVERVSLINPFNFNGSDVNAFYEHKMKVLLLDAALGMTPAKEWKGRYDANGGYLVVRNDGEIVCYHFYNINDVEDYLYSNTKFENASRNRHKFGSLFRGEDNQVYIRLNLQIRFTK